MKHFVVFVTTALLLSNLIDSENSEIRIVHKHAACFWNKKYVYNLTKARKPLNRTTSLSSIDLYFKPGVSLDSPIYMHIITYRKYATKYQPVMVNVKVELCEALKHKNHPLYTFFYMGTESNLLDLCPLKGHRFVRPYYTKYNIIPPLVPVGMWRIDIRLIKDEEEVLKVQNYYEVTAKGIIEF